MGKTRYARMGLGLVLSLPLVLPAVADEELRQPATEQTRAANAAVLLTAYELLGEYLLR